MVPSIPYKEVFLLASVVVWVLAARTASERWGPWLGAQLIIALVVESLASISGYHGLNNHTLYNAYMVLEFILINGMLVRSRTNGSIPKWIMIAGCIAYLSALIWNIVVSYPDPGLWTTTLIIGGSLLGIHAAHVLFHMANDGQRRLLSTPVFWVVLAVMVYFFTFIPVFGLYNYLTSHSEELANRVYRTNDLLFVLRYGLTLVGLIRLRMDRPSHK